MSPLSPHFYCTLSRLLFLSPDLFFLYLCAPLNGRKLNGRSKIWSENVERSVSLQVKIENAIERKRKNERYRMVFCCTILLGAFLAYLFPSHMKTDNFSCLIMFSHTFHMHILCFVFDLIWFLLWLYFTHLSYLYLTSSVLISSRTPLKFIKNNRMHKHIHVYPTQPKQINRKKDTIGICWGIYCKSSLLSTGPSAQFIPNKFF